MATTVKERIEAQFNTESHPAGSFAKHKTEVVWVGLDASLSSASLERGDTLHGDSNYEIIGSKIAHDSDGDRYVICQGYAEDTTSGSPWSELTGTRKIDDQLPNYIDWTITFTATTGATAPLCGESLADVMGAGNTLGTLTRYDGSPQAVFVSEVTQATKLKAHVAVRFRAHYKVTGRSTAAYQEIHPRIIRKTGREFWKGRRRFSCLVGHERNLERTLDRRVMPGYSGKYAPICEAVQTITGFKPTRSLVLADYETQRVPGEATVRWGVWYQVEKVQREPFGDERIIEGFDTDDPLGLHFYMVVEGSNQILVPHCTYIIETAYESYNPDLVASRVGHTNNATSFGRRKGSLLLLGTPHTKWWPKGSLWYYDYHLAYSGPYKLWNDFLKVRKYVHISRELVSIDSEGNVDPSAATRHMADIAFLQMTKHPEVGTTPLSWTKKATPIESRETHPEADFGDLNGMWKW